jgi:hypothetical protein
MGTGRQKEVPGLPRTVADLTILKLGGESAEKKVKPFNLLLCDFFTFIFS